MTTKTKKVTGIKISELKKDYFVFGNKGAVWSNECHIAKSDFHGTTLCGTPMLSGNYANDREWQKEYNITEARCPECIKKYNSEVI